MPRNEPARPRPDYARGHDRPHDDDAVEPNFARGLSETDPDEHGRFSRGHEELPEELPEKNVKGRFSEGVERSPKRS